MKHRCAHDPVKVVAGQTLFSSLTEDECAELVRRSHCRAVVRREMLFRQGDACRGLYLVVEGAARSYRSNKDGREQVFGVFGPGDSLGEVSLFDEGPHLASARVEQDGRVLFLPFAEVYSLYQSHPQVAQAVARELGNRIRSMTEFIDRITLQDVPTRVAAAVQNYAQKSGALTNGVNFRLPRTQEELAAELGTTREGVSRALRLLRTEAVIEQQGPRVRILDPGRLARLAAGGWNTAATQTSAIKAS